MYINDNEERFSLVLFLNGYSASDVQAISGVSYSKWMLLKESIISGVPPKGVRTGVVHVANTMNLEVLYRYKIPEEELNEDLVHRLIKWIQDIDRNYNRDKRGYKRIPIRGWRHLAKELEISYGDLLKLRENNAIHTTNFFELFSIYNGAITLSL